MYKPTFSQREWNDRIGGDFFRHSELKFENIWPGQWSHFGLGPATEGMATYHMSQFSQKAPDYIASLTDTSIPFFVEVQGTGKGGDIDGVRSHKFKQLKLDMLGKWNSHDEVTLWLWDDQTQTSIWTSYVSVRMMIAQGKAEQGLFDGKRPYWALPVDVIYEHADTERLMARYG